MCGCNACDETWEPLAKELEWQVFAIVSGGFSEEMGEESPVYWGRNRGQADDMVQIVSHTFRAVDGQRSRSGRSRAEDVSPGVLESARAVLRTVAAASADGVWKPWPRSL